MIQICKFDIHPATVNNGGFKRGQWIVWLNLNTTEVEPPHDTSTERFESVTDRLVLPDNTFDAFMQTVDFSHLSLATNDEVFAILSYFNVEDEVTAWQTIRKAQILGYDKSNYVNHFLYNGESIWLDKATRVGLMNSISIEKSAKRSETTLWVGATMVKTTVAKALAFLSQLELYAIDCFNITSQHIVEIDTCEDVETLKMYDIKADYPVPILFEA